VNLVKVAFAVTHPELLAHVPSREVDKSAERDKELASRDLDVLHLKHATWPLRENKVSLASKEL